MTAQKKYEELFKNCHKFFPSHGHWTDEDCNFYANNVIVLTCDEILKTKNYPNTLHPEMTAFNNAYWESVKAIAKNKLQ